ncbi:hypothetical protein GGF42_000281 [Coemansia sp. RSA 2424]|nr:hypothetical protein GGF42_000281 [Coemansia sp. RSA 2424]
MPLLWVCRNFRAVVHSNFCRTCELNLLSPSHTVFSKWCSPPLPFDLPDTSAFCLVKELDVQLDLWRVLTSRASGLISRGVYVDGILPQVCSIKLKLGASWERRNLLPGGSKESVAKVGAFAQQILRMAPNTRQISVVASFGQINMSRLTHQGVTDLILWFHQIATRNAVAAPRPGILQEPQLGSICNIVDLSCHVGHIGEHFVQLARQNALTLQSLAMSMSRVQDTVDLVQNSISDYIQYPCLRTLKHTSCEYEYEDRSEPLVFKGAVPFPSLQRLLIRTIYPFGDDTFFRGNAGMLERLAITLDRQTFIMLQRHTVFTASSHPNLRCVETSLASKLGFNNFAAPVDFIRFALSIGPAAPVRAIEDLASDILVSPQGFSAIGKHLSIQVLWLPRTNVQLWTIIALIKSLPLLSDLRTRMPSLGDMPDGTTLALLPDYVVSNYAPMGERFRCWSIVYEFGSIHNHVAHCVLLLALVFPNFSYPTVFGSNEPERLTEILERVLATDMYKPYAPQLSHLLSIG